MHKDSVEGFPPALLVACGIGLVLQAALDYVRVGFRERVGFSTSYQGQVDIGAGEAMDPHEA
mgnify:CR=1 FL=1